MSPNEETSAAGSSSVIRTTLLAGFSGIMVLAVAITIVMMSLSPDAGAVRSVIALAGIVALGAILVWIGRKTLPLLRELENAAKEKAVLESRSLAELQRSMEVIREGDLTAVIDRALFPVEFHALLETIQGSIAGFSTMLKKIQKTSAEVSTQAHRILETSGEQASGSSEQAAAVAEITSAMEELARTAAQIADNTHYVVNSSEESERRAQEGMTHMRGNASSLERMNERMRDINENAHNLGEKFQEIDKILALITSIASETHILALNAAIEAAAAGEYGARFSVIASEVRRLSDMSQDSVDEIKKILGEFQRSIQNTILATEQGTKEFETAMEAAFLIQEHLSAITDKVGHTTRSAKEIYLATQQQKTASDQIVETLKDVSSVIRQIANALQEFNRAATRLNALAMEMQLISQNFTIESDRNIKYLVKKSVESDDLRHYRKRNAAAVLDEMLQLYTFVELIYIADTEGILAAFAVRDHLKSEKNMETLTQGHNFSQRPWFINARDTRRAFITPMYKSALTGEECFTISAPITGLDGSFTGVLGVDVNAVHWSRID